MRSPTYIGSGKVNDYGTARNPWKVRASLPSLHDRIDPMILLEAAGAKRPTFDKAALARAIRNIGIPVTTGNMETDRTERQFHHVYAVIKGAKALQMLKSKLHGLLSLDALANGNAYAVRIIFPTFQTPGEFAVQIQSLTRRVNAYAHLRTILGASVLPLKFAGLHTGLGAYIIVSVYPENLLSVSRDDRGATPLFHQMVDAGVYPKKRGAVRKTETGEYRIFDPLSLLEIPKGIYTAYKRLRQTSDPAQAWVGSGGASWSAERGSTFEFHRSTGYTHPAPVTIASTVESHLSKAVKRPETGSATVRPVDPSIQQRLNALMASGTLIGRGSYGDVYSIRLTNKNRADLITISASLSNALSFRSLNSGGGKVVLKVEKLPVLSPLAKRTVTQLAGEAYIQEYVHANTGLSPEARETTQSVAPAVYFSGTIANAYHLICMDHVEGTSLWSVIKRGVVSNQVYNAMDRAVKTMLRNGVVHSDLHQMNVVLVKSGRLWQAQIIDFGFASIVPPLMKRSIAKTLDDTGSINAAFRETGLLNTVNAVKKNYRYYHSNAKLIADLKRLRNIGPMMGGIRSHPAKTARTPAKTAKTPAKLAKVAKTTATTGRTTGKRTASLSLTPMDINAYRTAMGSKLTPSSSGTTPSIFAEAMARSLPTPRS